jgi:exoribonuclease II
MITKTGKVNGGKRPGAGRPKGSANRDRAEQRHIAERLLEEGLTPLDIMTARMLGRRLGASISIYHLSVKKYLFRYA